MRLSAVRATGPMKMTPGALFTYKLRDGSLHEGWFVGWSSEDVAYPFVVEVRAVSPDPTCSHRNHVDAEWFRQRLLLPPEPSE